MKKLLSAVFVASVALSLSAQEAKSAVASAQNENIERKNESAVWPACVAVSQWPRSPDLVGLRLTIPFSSSQENVTGFDVGFWGVSEYFEGIQLNLLRNNVRDGAAAFQVGFTTPSAAAISSAPRSVSGTNRWRCAAFRSVSST
jgi:hypothetical protein